jgi:hypothetical protein
MWMAVVLPAPLGPKRPKHSPSSTVRYRPRTATLTLLLLLLLLAPLLSFPPLPTAAAEKQALLGRGNSCRRGKDEKGTHMKTKKYEQTDRLCGMATDQVNG